MANPPPDWRKCKTFVPPRSPQKDQEGKVNHGGGLTNNSSGQAPTQYAVADDNKKPINPNPNLSKQGNPRDRQYCTCLGDGKGMQVMARKGKI